MPCARGCAWATRGGVVQRLRRRDHGGRLVFFGILYDAADSLHSLCGTIKGGATAMIPGKINPIGQPLEQLWTTGTLTGLSDAQLLGRFAEARGRDASAESAFRELVHRHGAMVLGVCRQILRHPSRRGRRVPGHVPGPGAQGALDPGGRLAGPLALQRGVSHGATGSGRRRAISPRRGRDDGGAYGAVFRRRLSSFDFRPLLHEELNRLPGKFRDPIVLCHLEGKSHEEAARLLRGRSARSAADSRAADSSCGRGWNAAA